MTDEESKRHKLRAIQSQIKKSTHARKERKRAQTNDNTGQLVFLPHGDDTDDVANDPETCPHVTLNSSGTPDTSRGISENHTARDGNSALVFLRDVTGQSSPAGFFPQEGIFETDFIAKYLDHVFPFLFPFYKPAVFETGRSWLLSLLQHSKIALHAVLSLTAYFFTIALNDAYGTSYADCKDEVWARLALQADESFEDMQNTLQTYLTAPFQSSILDRIRMMEGITEVLLFESVIGKTEDWDLHLTPAITLIQQIFEANTGSGFKMLSALLSIGTPVWYKAENDSYIWSPDQAGFRLFTAILVFADIIASTALGREPRLRHLHTDILGEDDGAPVLGFTRIRLSSVLGIRNDIAIIIGETASLHAWKENTQTKDDSFWHALIYRATLYDQKLDAIIAAIAEGPEWTEVDNLPDLSLQPYTRRAIAKSPSAATTMIWAHSAKIYLRSVTNQYDVPDSETDEHVHAIAMLTQRLPANQFRTVAWPLCVAGCFAQSGDRHHFRSIFEAKTELELIGSPREAWRVIQEVWRRRESPDVDPHCIPFDLSVPSCLSVLGKAVLLI